ncbi:MAG TPA: hypothetical protein VGX76_03425 [Pirellulales bacterium]|jgi:hypothetical protein|nr:hypothetical protein [Pirellulales bacterium]
MANGASQYCGLPNLTAGPVLLPSATFAVAGTTFGTIVSGNNVSPSLGEFQSAAFLLDVTAAATLVGDTLDVSIQTTFDAVPTDGGLWFDIVHFAQVLGNGGAKRWVDKIATNLAQVEFERGTALAASSVRHIFGDAYRVKIAVVGTGSFTFSVSSNWK